MAAAPILGGRWAGDGVLLNAERGRLLIAFECAEATFDTVTGPDPTGRFRARGRLEAFAPGPDRSDESPRRTPPNATLEGRMDGTRMEIELLVDGAARRRYTLVEGGRAKPARCY